MNSIKISQMGVDIKGMMVNAKADIAMTVEGLHALGLHRFQLE